MRATGGPSRASQAPVARRPRKNDTPRDSWAPIWPSELEQEVARRRTFAIISHPDAGKTTLTEKLLLYGGAIHLAGSVKAKRARRHATSDWMELEKERGISVTSSVLQFAYRGHAVNLLDTPGHQDFSEDTYRTLAAADAAVMLIDAAKGVEPQTKKLFEVCRMRGIPIFTFVNKLDRYGREPLDLMDELEQVLGIRAYPMNWPIGMGPDFRGVYDRQAKRGARLRRGGPPRRVRGRRALGVASTRRRSTPCSTERELEQLKEDIELLDIGGDAFTREKSDAGQLTPDVLRQRDDQLRRAALPGRVPGPGARAHGASDEARARASPPTRSSRASSSRSRRTWTRRTATASRSCASCPGRYVKGMSAFHSRLGKEVRLAKPSQFLAAERTAIEDAWPGDVIGLFDPGQFRIGDTLAEGADVALRGRAALQPGVLRRRALARTRCAASRWRRAWSSSPRRARCRSSSSSRWA